tara:strand:+ start:6072 stop:7244 length:1173 start_codon:yes stop_codon:yes gene_type:complete
MEIKITKEDIETYILNYEDEGEVDVDTIWNDLKEIYTITTKPEEYVVKELLSHTIHKMNHKRKLVQRRKEQLKQLKKLVLPEQRSKEWYEMRKDKLTASSIASAIGHCHFQSRDELILSKIEEKPFEPNPITEWGVKYEDIAIKFYEELYNVKVLDFGLIPHPKFDAFGASPDGICDDTGNDEYVARMVEIKCPPKRKFTKTVPPHYGMQVQGQLEVCDLDECDFFQVKIEEYEDYEEYSKDNFINESSFTNSWGRTSLNFPKGCTITYIKANETKMNYLYPKLNLSDSMYSVWIQENKTMLEKKGHKFVEAKWWKITRYECSLVKRDHNWWIESIDKILSFYKDLLYYRNDQDALQVLKNRIQDSKKRKKKVEVQPMNEFQLISDNEDD